MSMTMKVPVAVFCSLFVLFVLHGNAGAQDIDTLASRYKDAHAVVTDLTNQIVIKNTRGQLTAHSTVTEERLLLSDMSVAAYNTQNIYHGYFDELEQVNAVSIVATKNGFKEIEVTDLKTTISEDDNNFFDDMKVTTASYTGLSRHSRTRMNYTLNLRDLHLLPGFYFQEHIPIAHATFSITAPRYVKIRYILYGKNTNLIKYSTTEGRNTITYTWTAADIPQTEMYKDGENYSYYLPHVLPYIAEYKLPGDDTVTQWLGTPALLYGYYYNYIKNVNKTDDAIITATAAEITKGDINDRQKARHIYEWVQKNMHYVAFEDSLGGFIPREAPEICHRKFGDCKDMTSILVALCRKAGLDAHFTWIGTSVKPYKFSDVPLPVVTNHMICAIMLGGNWIFMDGTDPITPFGYPPYSIQGKEAMVSIDEHNFKILLVPEMSAATSNTTDTTLIAIDGKNITGSAHLHYKGYVAWQVETYMKYDNEEQQEKKIKSITSRGSNKFFQKSYDIATVANDDKDFVVNNTFKIDDFVQKAGKEYFVNMNLSKVFEDEHIEPKGRDVPVAYRYKNCTHEVVILQVPAGYHVSYIPHDKKMATDNLWGFNMQYIKGNNQLILVKDYELMTRRIEPAQFEDNNKMVNELNNQYKESVVLTAN